LEERDHVQSVLPADLEAVASSVVEREGVIWSLGANSDLNANLIRLGAGQGVGEHVNGEVDVLFVGVSGAGLVDAGGREHTLNAGKLVFVPKGTRRSTRGTSEDFVYLTVHRRRGPLRIGARTDKEEVKDGRETYVHDR
jgi:quercetin dioxygenase-like cupin family protein